ncbi:hypothetical protein PUV54_00055 [Hyphococcus flavus]|uniref:Uncharacterized protein n=1 Tax=Hyphococcus flavus TaxID=1866326 RepID=A0AAF0CEN4_9PROT|nr:hypothetical protein [Hyphococcus flavus]WDI31586.1 hypothetical protein PUV54_00055 [Hyphococcus flavus]
MGWSIETYDGIRDQLGENLRLPERASGAGVKVKAPCCGRWVLPVVLVDARHWPAALSGGAPFVCDGCWTQWEREGRDDGTGQAFDEARMYEMNGAPVDFVQKARGIINRRAARFPIENRTRRQGRRDNRQSQGRGA